MNLGLVDPRLVTELLRAGRRYSTVHRRLLGTAISTDNEQDLGLTAEYRAAEQELRRAAQALPPELPDTDDASR